jgi:hypothetical protein
MTELDKNKLLTEKISAVLQGGIRIDRAALHFIDSTFDSPSVEQLCRILSDSDSCDALTVYELLLFPDETTQMLIEPDLVNKNYAQSDLDEIRRVLRRAKLSIRFTFPDDRKAFRTIAPESAVIQFVQRLNILNRMDASIDQALSRFIPDQTDYLKARVCLRNRRFEFSDAILEFFAVLVEKTCSAKSAFWEALTYMIEFFNTYPSIQDIESALIEKRRTCVHLLELSEKNKKALEENAVETLLMRGARISSVGVEEIRKEIDLIDYIRFTLYSELKETSAP